MTRARKGGARGWRTRWQMVLTTPEETKRKREQQRIVQRLMAQRLRAPVAPWPADRPEPGGDHQDEESPR
jgi:hypothetical protein